jgi:predicted nucleotidyltransferase
MIPPAPNKEALKKRVNRFFSSKSVANREVNEVISSLTDCAETYIFGGMIRDIGLFGLNKFESDIDLVFDGNRSMLLSVLNKAKITNYSENKFGGFRVKQSKWDIDIWATHDTWAIKEGHVDFDNVTSLLDTVLMTWDSVLYNLSTKQIIYKDSYLDDLVSGRLEVVLDKNPNQLGSAVRVLRAIYGKHASCLGDNARLLLIDTLFSYNIDDFLSYEKSSYSKRYLNASKIIRLRDSLVHHDGEEDFNVSQFSQLNLNF